MKISHRNVMSRSVLGLVLPAFAILLLPLQVSSQDTGGQEQDEEELQVLDPFVVEAESIGYRASNSTSTTRMAVKLQDIPQAIAIVTADFMEDAGIYDNRDALKYVTNVTPRATSHQPGTFFIRGLQTNQTYVDGVRISPHRMDMAPFERVEMIKGPASASIGRGEPSGLTNYVRKRPLQERRLTTKFTFGNYSFFRGHIDAAGPLSEDKTVTYRLNMVYQDTDTWKDLMHFERTGIYPSVKWELSPKTTIVFDGTFLNTNAPGAANSMWWNHPVYRENADNITIAFIDADAELVPNELLVAPKHVVVEPGDHHDRDFYDAVLTITHSFSDWLFFRQAFRAEQNTLDMDWVRDRPSIAIWQADGLGNDGLPWQGRGPEPQVNDLVVRNRQVLVQDSLAETGRAVGDLLFSYKVLGQKQRTLVGYEVVAFSSEFQQESWFAGDANMTRPYYGGENPEPLNSLRGVYGDEPGIDRDTADSAFEHSYFFQHEAEFFNGFFRFMGGWRFDRRESWQKNNLTGTESFRPTDKTNAPRFSGTFHPYEWLTVYGLYSKQVDPERTRFRFGGIPAFDPRSQEQISAQRTGLLYEAGVKSELFNGKVSANFAWFELHRDNNFINKPGPGDVVDSQGRAISVFQTVEYFAAPGELVKGFEIDVWGQPTERLSLVTNWAFISESREPAGRVDDAGNPVFLPSVQAVPDWQGVFFAKYDMRNSDGNGVQTKLGLQLYGPMVPIPRFCTCGHGTQTTLDMGVSYTWGKHTFDLQVNNVTNDRFIVAGNSEFSLRQFLFSVTSKW
jgi:iron complex outermembrane receptor protein